MQKKLFPIFVAILVLGLLYGLVQSFVLNWQAANDIDSALKRLVETAQQIRQAPIATRGDIRRDFLDSFWDAKAAVYGDSQGGAYLGPAGALLDFFAENPYEFDGTSVVRNRERISALAELRVKANGQPATFHVMLVNTRDRYNTHRWIPIRLLTQEQGYHSAVTSHLFPTAGFDPHPLTGDALAPTPPGALAAQIGSAAVPGSVAVRELIADSTLRAKLQIDADGRAHWTGTMTVDERTALLNARPSALVGELPWMKFVNQIYLASQWQAARTDAAPTGNRASFEAIYRDLFGTPEAPGYLTRAIQIADTIRDSQLAPLGRLIGEIDDTFRELDAQIAALPADATDRLDNLRAHQVALLHRYYQAEARVLEVLAAEGIEAPVAPQPAGISMAELTAPAPAAIHPLAGEPDPGLKSSRVFAHWANFEAGEYRDFLACAIRVRFIVDRKRSFEPETSSPLASAQLRLAEIFTAVSTLKNDLTSQREGVRQLYNSIVASGNVNKWVRDQRYSTLNEIYSTEASGMRAAPEGGLQRAMNAMGEKFAGHANRGDFDGLTEWLEINKSIPIEQRDAKLRDIFTAIMEGYRQEVSAYNKRMADQFGTTKSTLKFEMPRSADFTQLPQETQTAQLNAYQQQIQAAIPGIIATLSEANRARLSFDAEELSLSVTGIISYPMFVDLKNASDNPQWRYMIVNLAKKTDDLRPRFFDFFGFAGYTGKLVEFVVVAVPIVTPQGVRITWRPVMPGDVYSSSVARPWAKLALDARHDLVAKAPFVDEVRAPQRLAQAVQTKAALKAGADLAAAVAQAKQSFAATASVAADLDALGASLEAQRGLLTANQAEALKQSAEAILAANVDLAGHNAALTALRDGAAEFVAAANANDAAGIEAHAISAETATATVRDITAAVHHAMLDTLSAPVAALNGLAANSETEFDKIISERIAASATANARMAVLLAVRLTAEQNRVASRARATAATAQVENIRAQHQTAQQHWATVAGVSIEEISAARQPRTPAESAAAEVVARLTTELATAEAAATAAAASATAAEAFFVTAQAQYAASRTADAARVPTYFDDLDALAKRFKAEVVDKADVDAAVAAYFTALAKAVTTYKTHFAAQAEIWQAQLGDFSANLPLYEWALTQEKTQATLDRLMKIRADTDAIAAFYQRLTTDELKWIKARRELGAGFGHATATDGTSSWPQAVRRLALLKSLLPQGKAALPGEIALAEKLERPLSDTPVGEFTVGELLQRIATAAGVPIELPTAPAGDEPPVSVGPSEPELVAAVNAKLRGFVAELPELQNFVAVAADPGAGAAARALAERMNVDLTGKTVAEALSAVTMEHQPTRLWWTSIYRGTIYLGTGQSPSAWRSSEDMRKLQARLNAVDVLVLESQLSANADNPQGLATLEAQMREINDAILDILDAHAYDARITEFRSAALKALSHYATLIKTLDPGAQLPAAPSPADEPWGAMTRRQLVTTWHSNLVIGAANRRADLAQAKP